MPDDQTIALIKQLQLRVIDLEIAVSKPKQAELKSFYDEARRNIRDMASAQIRHRCQTQNAEKSKPLSGDRS